MIKPVYPKRCPASGGNVYKVMAVVGGQRYRFRGSYKSALEYAEKVNRRIERWNEVNATKEPVAVEFSSSRRVSF